MDKKGSQELSLLCHKDPWVSFLFGVFCLHYHQKVNTQKLFLSAVLSISENSLKIYIVFLLVGSLLIKLAMPRKHKKVEEAKSSLNLHFGENWSTPNFLHVLPFFMARKRPTGKRPDKVIRGDVAERCLLQVAHRLKETKNCPHGYFLMNTKIRNFIPENELETDGIFVSEVCIIIFEVKNRKNVKDANKEATLQLKARVEAVTEITRGSIPVKGAIVIPFTDRLSSDQEKLDFPILYREDLCPEAFSSWISTEISKSGTVHSDTYDQINAMAEIMSYAYLERDYSPTLAEATEFQKERIALQRHKEYQGCFKFTFNSIEFTMEQVRLAKKCIQEIQFYLEPMVLEKLLQQY